MKNRNEVKWIIGNSKMYLNESLVKRIWKSLKVKSIRCTFNSLSFIDELEWIIKKKIIISDKYQRFETKNSEFVNKNRVLFQFCLRNRIVFELPLTFFPVYQVEAVPWKNFLPVRDHQWESIALKLFLKTMGAIIGDKIFTGHRIFPPLIAF